MSEARERAFRAAEAEIARGKAAGEVVLSLGVSGRLGPSAEYLSDIPAEIADAAKVTRLHLAYTKVSDLNPITL